MIPQIGSMGKGRGGDYSWSRAAASPLLSLLRFVSLHASLQYARTITYCGEAATMCTAASAWIAASLRTFLPRATFSTFTPLLFMRGALSYTRSFSSGFMNTLGLTRNSLLIPYPFTKQRDEGAHAMRRVVSFLSIPWIYSVPRRRPQSSSSMVMSSVRCPNSPSKFHFHSTKLNHGLNHHFSHWYAWKLSLSIFCHKFELVFEFISPLRGTVGMKNPSLIIPYSITF